MDKNNKTLDLRSDTVTKPTTPMYEAIRTAELGDDVYGDDPTVNLLERRAAEILGMESALFVPTGTFGNQLAIFTWCKRGDEVILGEDCHIIAHEVGGAAVIAGVQLRAVPFCGGMPDARSVRKRVRVEREIHEPVTSLICLENALANGRVVPLNIMREVYETAKEFNLPLHLDGARLFNAAASLGVEAREIAAYTDSVMFCLSKGLCAPVGSILAGKAEFIEEARRGRKLLGGGMRQAGILAAPALVALDVMPKRLIDDHKNAALLGALLSEIGGVSVVSDIEINMVFFTIDCGTDLAKELLARGIIINGAERDGTYRIVTHNDVDENDIRRAAAAIGEVIKKSRA